MKTIFRIACVTFLLSVYANFATAQTTYRSVANGLWDASTTWETSTDLITWVPAGGTPGAANDVIIKTGTTVTLAASGKNARNLTIQAGATLTASGATERTLRINNNTLLNDGTLGNVNEVLAIELNTGNTTGGFTITGSGTAKLNRIRMAAGNTTSPVNTITVNQDVITYVGVNGIGTSYAFSAAVAPGNVAENYVLTLNAGKTVTVLGGTWHSGTSSGVPPAGTYTYNINGTLDMSGSTTTSQNTFAGSASDASKALTVNINGTVKLPTSGLSTLNFGEGAAAGQLGSVIFNISGLLDASNAPINNTTTTIAPRLFNMTPTGLVSRIVGAAATNFPVSAGGSNNSAVLNNAGTSDAYRVGVKTTLDNPAPDASKIVNRQWTVTEAVAGGSDVTVSLSWQTADQAAGFSPAQTVAILRWTGAVWEPHVAVVTGSGTANDPYVATATGFTAFSPLIVANFSAVPISFANAAAYTKNQGVQVDWKISDDGNVRNYEVERSVDGRSFTTAGVVAAQAGTSLKSYSFFDANPIAGASFYRIKSVNADGSGKYSPIMKVSINAGRQAINISPNPVVGRNVNIQLTDFAKGSYTVNIFSSAGQKVYTGKIISEGGSVAQTLQLPATIKKGTYNVQVTNGELKFSKSILVD